MSTRTLRLLTCQNALFLGGSKVIRGIIVHGEGEPGDEPEATNDHGLEICGHLYYEGFVDVRALHGHWDNVWGV